MLHLRSTAAAIALVVTLAGPALATDTSKEEIKQLQDATDKAPTSPDAHFDLAMGYARTIKLETAYAELRKVADLDPRYADKVVTKYEPLFKSNPKNVEAAFRLAFGYYFKGLNAQQDADTLAKTDKAKADAASQDATKYKAQARQAFQAIVEADPKYVWGYNYLGYMIAESGDLDQGEATWRKAIGVEDNAVSHFLLGQALMKQGRIPEGALETATAMRMRGLNP